MTRHWELDALRGLMLVLMTLTHLPTRLASPLGQPLGYVSAAEGFVLLSAFMAGMVYSRQGRRFGLAFMRQAFWRRALTLYGCQVAALVFLFSIIALLGVVIDQPAVKNLMHFYLEQPQVGLLAGLALVYQPPLLDILPLYVLFMLASPWVLVAGLLGGWAPVIGLSLGLWVAAQFGATAAIYAFVVRHTGLPVPFQETGAFDTLAWQLVWVLGLWMGASAAVAPQALPSPAGFPRWMVGLALAIGAGGLVARHWAGQAPLQDMPALAPLLDKWTLGPLRLISLLALMVLLLRFGPALAARMPFRPRALEALGRASLPVFCAHLVAVLLVLALYGEYSQARTWPEDAGVLILSFALLMAVAEGWPQLTGKARAARRQAGQRAGAGGQAPQSASGLLRRAAFGDLVVSSADDRQAGPGGAGRAQAAAAPFGLGQGGQRRGIDAH